LEHFTEFFKNDIFRKNYFYRKKGLNFAIPSFEPYKWIGVLLMMLMINFSLPLT